MGLLKKSKTTDDLSFKEAFKVFRKKHGGDGGRFKWKGKVYTTDLKKATSTTSKSPTRKSPAKPKAPSKDKPPSRKGTSTTGKPSVSTDMRETALRFGTQGRANALSASKTSQKPVPKKKPKKRNYENRR